MPPRRIITAGGGTKNAAMDADHLRYGGNAADHSGAVPVLQLRRRHAGGIGRRALESFAALRAALPQGRILQPDRKNHEFYQEHYPIFRDLYLENRDQDAQNAKIRRRLSYGH